MRSLNFEKKNFFFKFIIYTNFLSTEKKNHSNAKSGKFPQAKKLTTDIEQKESQNLRNGFYLLYNNFQSALQKRATNMGKGSQFTFSNYSQSIYKRSLKKKHEKKIFSNKNVFFRSLSSNNMKHCQPFTNFDNSVDKK